jgi:hypothetical protein
MIFGVRSSVCESPECSENQPGKTKESKWEWKENSGRRNGIRTQGPASDPVSGVRGWAFSCPSVAAATGSRAPPTPSASATRQSHPSAAPQKRRRNSRAAVLEDDGAASTEKSYLSEYWSVFSSRSEETLWRWAWALRRFPKDCGATFIAGIAFTRTRVLALGLGERGQL